MPNLGKRISQFRKLQRLTQKDFAKQADITYRHFQDIEGDKSNIKLSTAGNIASILKIPIQTLFDQSLSVDLLNAGINESWQILESLPLGVCVSNLEGRILYSNRYFREQLSQGQPSPAVENQCVWDLLPEKDRAKGKLDFLRVLRERPQPSTGARIYQGTQSHDIKVKIMWDYIYDENEVLKGFISCIMPNA
jgi:PAS domain S-box-containing protein